MNYQKNKNNNLYTYIFWVGLFIIMLLRSFYFGIDYFKFLDDYNTYGIFYRLNYDIWNNIIMHYRHFTWRPIAFFLDAYVTQWFWSSMWVLLLFYTTMHFFTVVFFYKIMKKSEINFGIFGIIIISLSPILFESVYWVGASTRLVAGMFFSILSVYFMLFCIEKNQHYNKSRFYLFLYIFFNFVSTGFYEQIIVFNLVFTLIIIVVNDYKIRYYLKTIYLTPIVVTIFMVVFYIVLAPYGRVLGRANMVSLYSLPSHIINTTFRILYLLTFTTFEISYLGFFRGINLMLSIFGIFIFIFLSGFVFFNLVSFFVLKIRVIWETEEKNYVLRIIISIILIFAPFGPFYLLSPQTLPPRVIYPSIFGIALFLDTIIDIINEIFWNKFIKPLLTAVVIIPFFIVYIAEVNNFRLLEEIDYKISYNFMQVFNETDYSDTDNILIFNTRVLYSDVTGGGSPHRLENISSSDWAFLGKLNATFTDTRFFNIKPVPNNSSFVLSEDLENRFFGIDENLDFFVLSLQNNILYIQTTRDIFGIIEQHENYFIFVRNN
ncbi:MAG: hypothetical protein FWF57_06320 [Defluviitaleaceae bacterium]|nr:hypothetical protein [Defluviitaleaceae bacterium]